MTDVSELEQRLAALVDEIASVTAKEHELVRQRNDVMRAMLTEHGMHPRKVQQLARLGSLPLVYRIKRGENR
jgi:hypothetical protein